MVGKFTRKFDPEKPRNQVAEEFDTHQRPSEGPVPRIPPWVALVLPGGRPHSLYHGRRDCEAFMADVRLADQCGQDVKPQIVKLDEVRSREDRTGCPLCRPTETDYSRIEDCRVETGAGSREGMRLLWRKDPAAGWRAIVMYRSGSRIVAEVRREGELRRPPGTT